MLYVDFYVLASRELLNRNKTRNFQLCFTYCVRWVRNRIYFTSFFNSCSLVRDTHITFDLQRLSPFNTCTVFSLSIWHFLCFALCSLIANFISTDFDWVCLRSVTKRQQIVEISLYTPSSSFCLALYGQWPNQLAIAHDSTLFTSSGAYNTIQFFLLFLVLTFFLLIFSSLH